MLRAIRISPVLYPLLNGAHIIGFALLFGAVAAFDLRVVGVFKGLPWQVLEGPLLKVARTGFALAVATGSVLFAVRATHYAANPAFLLKLGLLVLALGNAVAFRRTARLRPDGSRSLRLLAGMSLLLWVMVLLAGRWIGFL